MSWKFGGIYFKANFENQIDRIFKKVNCNWTNTGRFIRFSDALKVDFLKAAVGYLNDITIVQNNFLIYDCSFEEHNLYHFDKSLIHLSLETDILCFGIDEISDTLLYSLYKNGTLKMRKSVVSGKLVLYETDGIISCRSDENNKKDNLDELATLLFQFAGFRLNDLLLNDNFMLEVYI